MVGPLFFWVLRLPGSPVPSISSFTDAAVERLLGVALGCLGSGLCVSAWAGVGVLALLTGLW